MAKLVTGDPGPFSPARRRGAPLTAPGLNRVALLWIVTASVLGAGLFVWPLHVVLIAGQNADISLGLALLWAMAVVYWSPMPETRGRWLRRVLTGLDLLALILVWCVDGLLVNQLASMLQTFFYFDTPRGAIVLPLLLLVGWAVNRSTDTVWRVVGLILPILLVSSLAIFALAFVNVHHWRPVAPNAVIVIGPILHGLGVLAFVAVPLGVTARRVMPRLAAPPSWRLRMESIAIPWLFLTVLYVLVIGSIGPSAMTELRWPVVSTLDHVTLDSTFFLSRIGIVVIFSWAAGLSLALMIHLRLFFSVVHVRSTQRWALTGVALGGWTLVALIMSSPEISSHYLIQSLNPLCRAYLVLELLLLVVAGAWSGRRKMEPPSDSSALR